MLPTHLVLCAVCTLTAECVFGAAEQDKKRTVTFNRTLPKEDSHRGDISRMKRDVNHRSSQKFTPCKLDLAADDWRKLDQNTHETAFHGDSGSSFTLTWVGDGTGVILVLSTVNAPLGLFSERGSSRLYRSEDYGKTFHDISEVINNTFIHKEFGIITGPGNSQHVILTADVPASEKSGGIIFTSVDAGVTFKQIQLSFHPDQPISFHFLNPNYLVVISVDSALWLSENFGNKWNKIHEGVKSFMWGPGITLFFSYSPKGRVDADRRGKVLLRRTADLGQTFTTIAQNIFSFGYIGGFLFTSVMEEVGAARFIFVSSDQGASFSRAKLPSATTEQFYSVLDGDEDMIFMHVDDPGETFFGTVYTSDDQGVVYSKSLERHLFGAEGKSDFTNITSLRGVYLTNVLEQDGRIRTVISFDRGGEWKMLRKPENVECGNGVRSCNLHIHGEYSRVNGLAPILPLTDPSAVGLIIAHGSLGNSITSEQPDVFVSSDGGYTWTQTLRGPHHYAVLDSGGLLVAVECHREPLLRTIKFSTDEGQCWKSYNFTDHPIFFVGLASEPGTKTMNISIWGYRTEQDYSSTWVAITIDFEHLLTKECEEQDYEKWVAHSSIGQETESEGCVLGYKETFRRLKKLSVCRNGRDYVVSREQSPCLCTRDDYLCDYGYYRHENTSECVVQLDFRDKALELCRNGEEEEIQISGYRKVPGNRCEGGFTASPGKVTKHCGNSTEASSFGFARDAVLPTAVCVGVSIVALIAAACLIVKKCVCGGRTPVYRFSALQLQEDDPCITIDSERDISGNRVAYHGDSDEDLIE